MKGRFVGLGGDVDTTGAVSGASNGVGAIPQEMTRQINDRERYGYDYLAGLAERLWELRAG